MNEKRYDKLVLEAPEGFEISVKEGNEGEVIFKLVPKTETSTKNDGWDGV